MQIFPLLKTSPWLHVQWPSSPTHAETPMATTISPATPEAHPQPTPQLPQNPEEVEAPVFRSRLPDISISDNLPIHAYCLHRHTSSPDHPALIDATSDRSYTISETHLLSRRSAAGLARLGVSRGDVIMLLLHNCPEFAFTFLGASMLGAASTPANPFCTPLEISKQFHTSGAKLVVTFSAYVDKLRGGELFPADLVIVTVDRAHTDRCLTFAALSEADEGEVEQGRVDVNTTVALPFSSGTTGLAKGVMLTHRSMVTSMAQQVDGENPNLYLTPNDVVLCVLPLFHVYALSSILLCSLRAGSTVLLVKKFEMAPMLELIQRYRVTVANVVPPLVLALARNPVVEDYDLSSIRIVQSGAAPLGKDLVQALGRRLPHAIFGQGYGMTEAGPVLSMCSAFAKRPFPAKNGSCGIIVRNAEMKVISIETGLSLPRNRSGEICIRGKQIMKGYLNDPEATSRTIDAEGWLHTGDVGFVDDDGEVFIVDRVKELIKFKGFQVPPAELESLLINNPSIADAAVVPQEDEAAGEVPVAFVVRSDEGAELTEEAVKDFVAKHVVFYKRLHRVIFTHAIPKSPSGKILRKHLKAKLNSTT